MSMAKKEVRNCIINEQTGDGTTVGRCWFTLENGICPRHGNVRKASDKFLATGMLTLERDHLNDSKDGEP